MSMWTHVAIVIRFDGSQPQGDEELTIGQHLKPDLGKKFILDRDDDLTYEDFIAAENACTVPKGSEGSLYTNLWVNPDPSHMAAYTATIWGDLRDYDDVDEIIAYLNRITEGKWVRQGVATIEVEKNSKP